SHELLIGMMVVMPLRLPRRKVGNSQLRAQFTVKDHLQFRKRPPEFTGVEKVRRISRATAEIKLCFRVGLKQQHPSKTKTPTNLPKQQALQVPNTNNHRIAIRQERDSSQSRF